MSVQACRIKGIGHILNEGELPPRFNKLGEGDELGEFWDESGLRKNYWFFAKHNGKDEWGKENNASPIGACFDHMSGKTYFVGVITEASYLECSEPNWDRVKFRNDDWVKKYAGLRIKYVFGIEAEPKEVEFEIYQ